MKFFPKSVIISKRLVDTLERQNIGRCIRISCVTNEVVLYCKFVTKYNKNGNSQIVLTVTIFEFMKLKPIHATRNRNLFSCNPRRII